MENNPHPLTLVEMVIAAKKRVSLISKEFEAGFNFLINYPRSVTIFGSTKTVEGDQFYENAVALAGKIVKELHYSIITGGGPGIMEAANKGAFEAGGQSLGLTIELPGGQITNKYLTDKVGFHYFFSRKVCLAFSAEAYIFFPGGFGTLDEFLEILTLIQTHKIPQAPMILFGKDYWQPLEEYFKNTLVAEDKIKIEDLNVYTITENEEEILEIIKKAPVRFGVEYDQKSENPGKNNHSKKESGPLSYLSKKIGW